jgi:hypothetical protein
MLGKIYANFCNLREQRDARTMQCKHIPELPVLLFLQSLGGRWANWFESEYENSVRIAMPAETPGKLALAKMRNLMRRGLVDGCPCGCRGDFRLTQKGHEYIAAQATQSLQHHHPESYQ